MKRATPSFQRKSVLVLRTLCFLMVIEDHHEECCASPSKGRLISSNLLNGDLRSPSLMRFPRRTEVFHGCSVVQKARIDLRLREPLESSW